MNTTDPLGLGNFNSQALHPDENTMNSGALPSRPQHAQPQGPSGIAGFLARNAPAIGGTIGGILAAPANLLDAVSGAGGTAIDVGAAAVGTDIGQRFKNKYDSSQASNPEKEALIGGVTQLATAGLGKYAAKGGSALKNILSSTIAKQADKKVTQAGYDEFAKVKPGILERNDLNGTMDKLKQLNLPQNSKGMQIYHDSTTGDNGAISSTMRQILGNTPNVDVGTIVNDDVIKAVRAHGIGDPMKRGSQANQLLGDIRDTVNSYLFPGGTLDSKADPNKIFDIIQYAGTQKNKFAAADPGTFAAAQHDAWTSVKNNLEDKLYNNGGVDKAVAAYKLAPEDEAAIRTMVQRRGGSQELADHIVGGINNASRGKEMRALQIPAVRAGNLADAAATKAAGALPKSVTPNVEGLSPADAMKLAVHVHSGGVTALPGLALNAIKATGGGAEKLALNGLNAAGKVATSKPGMVARVALPQLAVQGQAGADQAASNIQAANGTNAQLSTGPISSMVSNQVNSVLSSANQATNPQSNAIPQLTAQQINQILQSSGTEGLRGIEGAIDTQLAIQKQESPQLTSTQQDQISDITKSLQGLTLSSQLYEQAQSLGAGIGQGKVLGMSIPGLQNTKAEAALKAYESNRGELAAQLATVLGSGKSSAAMLKQIETMLPDATTAPAAAQTMFSNLVNRLNASMQDTLALPATNTPGQLTNFAGQSVPGLPDQQPSNLGLLNFIGAQ
jgi:hypothetical protein